MVSWACHIVLALSWGVDVKGFARVWRGSVRSDAVVQSHLQSRKLEACSHPHSSGSDGASRSSQLAARRFATPTGFDSSILGKYFFLSARHQWRQLLQTCKGGREPAKLASSGPGLAAIPQWDPLSPTYGIIGRQGQSITSVDRNPPWSETARCRPVWLSGRNAISSRSQQLAIHTRERDG